MGQAHGEPDQARYAVNQCVRECHHVVKVMVKRPRSPSLTRPAGPLGAEAITCTKKSLMEFWSLPQPRPKIAYHAAASSRTAQKGIPVVDLFCGCGGYSCGAALAGHHVALAIDCDAVALAVHRANHPYAAHANIKLGLQTESQVIELIRRHVPENGPWLLHGSPPCITFSNMRNITKGKAHDAGMELVTWYINLVKKLAPPYWSFEQVAMMPIKHYLRAQGLAYHAFDFSLYGVPQTRTRCLAGTPDLIHALRDNKSLRVAAPITPAMLLTPPPTATRIRASGGKCIELFYRPLDVPTWCLLTACKPVYVNDAGACVRVMSTRELLVLQTFPPRYRMPAQVCCESDRVRLIGNAVPPLMSCLLLKPLHSSSSSVSSTSSSSTSSSDSSSFSKRASGC